MKLSDFDYTLPPEAIAMRPIAPRHQARLLDMTGGGVTDRHMINLPNCFNKNDLLIVNNTKVIHANLKGKRGEASIDITLHQRHRGHGNHGNSGADDDEWRCFARPAKKLRLGDKIIFADDLSGAVTFIGENGERGIRFSQSGEGLDRAIARYGTIPLPPYIRRPDGTLECDRYDYQTMFASQEGAVAAPTAGLHFDETLMRALADKGIEHTEVTLHVGAGTFLPVKTDNPRDHKMHREYGEITPEAADKINQAIARGGKVIAVGTTSLRLLESCYRSYGAITAYQGETDLFILPGFSFGVVDMLVTNFHLPKSTLLMLVHAFAGGGLVSAAYQHAIEAGYRFFSYGDACLMERHDREVLVESSNG